MNAKNKPNGHGALLAKGHGANVITISSSGAGRAASVDASELSVANATASSAAAGAEREAYAEVALPVDEGKQLVSARAASRSPNRSARRTPKEKEAERAPRKILPGLEPLPLDGEAVVDAVHAKVDLVQLEVELLNSEDEKVVQRELAYLRELRYGKHAPLSDDGPPQIIVDIPGPERDTP
jgi:hypothetical protein